MIFAPILIAALLPSELVPTSSTATVADVPPAEVLATPEDRIETLEGKIDSVLEPLAEVRGQVEALTKLKFSGYIQGRFEHHGDSMEGLNAALKPGQTNQFLIRRGRLKATYAGTYAELVLQIDATPKGVVLKDVEATFVEPWTGLGMRLTLGQFQLPFGYEVPQSSSVREMPERARVSRTLFPGERDRGLRFQARWEWLRVAACVINGNGTEDPIYGANDQNQFKDVCGRVGFDLGWLAGGVSGYYGEHLQTKLGPPVSYTSFSKIRLGADLQLYVDVPSLGGLALKAEAIRATELGDDGFGFWVLAVQNLGDHFALFSRVDRWDKNITKADDGTTTVGGGGQWLPSGNFRLSGVYEHVINEGKPISDDVLTVQLQVKF